MRFGFALVCFLFAFLVGCSKKTVTDVVEVDFIQALCQVEIERHGDVEGKNIVFINNHWMDAYLEAPRDARYLAVEIEQNESLCRGALVQLFARAHGNILLKDYDAFRKRWTETDWFHVFHVLRYGDLAKETQRGLFRRMLADSFSTDLRMLLPTLLREVELSDERAVVLRLMEGESDPLVLGQLVLSINWDRELAEAVAARDDIEDQDFYLKLLGSWALESFAGREDVIRSFLDHDMDSVSTFAGQILNRLAQGENYEVKTRLSVIAAEPRVHEEATVQLWTAFEQYDFPAAEAAVMAGADLTSRDERGDTVMVGYLGLTDSRSNRDLYEKLGVESAPGGWEVVRDAHRERWFALLKKMVDRGLDVNQLDRHERGGLHLAVLKGDADLVRFLLARGADTTWVDSTGMSPLGLAALMEHGEIVSVLTTL